MAFLLYKPKQILNYQRKVCVLFFILFQFVMNLNKETFVPENKTISIIYTCPCNSSKTFIFTRIKIKTCP